MERENRKNPSEKENAGRLETQEGCECMTKNYGFYSKGSGKPLNMFKQERNS